MKGPWQNKIGERKRAQLYEGTVLRVIGDNATKYKIYPRPQKWNK